MSWILKIWYIFLYLQVVMKNVIVKILAVMLTVWYSMSVIGFDVHTCSGSGRSFVVTFIEGLTCEDIHPEHSCDKASCCTSVHDGCCHGHSDHTSDKSGNITAKSCCSSDYQVLALTGTLNSQDHDHFDECICGLCPCTGLPVCETPSLYNEFNQVKHIQRPESGADSAGERLAALRVWRI